jgi:3-hydroxy-9,10-secoandrosta-1,3,5(10)-triene-9,17-dione monooxygenase reductase component
MSIHREHPFLPPEQERSPLRRFRGRMAHPVSLWTSSDSVTRAGWTVSSMMVAEGPTPVLVGLLDEDSDLAGLLDRTGRLAVSLLGWPNRALADAFAGLTPAPGGPFRMTGWVDTEWGPVPVDAPAWLGARVRGPHQHAGWSLLVRAEIERIEVGDLPVDGLLGYLRGRYVRLGGD